jgi:PhoH-like ATPase
MKKIYVLDTSVYLTDCRSLSSFGNNDIIIPLIVLEEIDKHKKRPDTVGTNARGTIRSLDELRTKGSLFDGIKINKNAGKVFTKNFDPTVLPDSYDSRIPDNMIIATALTEAKNNPNRKVILVSCDINMRVKCDSLGLETIDYTSDQIIKERSELYSGFATLLVDDQLIDLFYNKEPVYLPDKEAVEQKLKVYPNQFLMLVSNSNDKKSALARYIDSNTPLKRIKETENVWGGVMAKNKEQAFALDLLLDPSIPVVTLVGKAGSGKTLCAIAAGLQQIMPNMSSNKNNTKLKEKGYTRLIVSRPVQPLGKDIGFLPGSLEEKMSPWLSPIQDNLRFLFGDDQIMLTEYMDRGIIEIEALTYIRGRSIQNAFIIIDECQNISRHEMKTILTRVGNGSKIVLTGDIEQIDNIHVDETTNGLTHAIEKLKDFDVSGHITLVKGERSKVATIASQAL